MRHVAVDETLLNVAASAAARQDSAAQFARLPHALRRVGEEVVGKAPAHQAGASEGEGDAAGVNGDPTAPPLLGDVRSGATATGGIENEIAGVSGHEDASFDYSC